MEELTLALDLGSSSFKFALISSKRGQLYSSEYSFETKYEENGEVEIDADSLWDSINEKTESILNSFKSEEYPSFLSISTQRESVLLWCAQTGKAITPIISWQDSRTDYIVDELSLAQQNLIRERTGLWISSYCSAPKLSYLFEHYSEYLKTPYLWGTLDSWLIYKFTHGIHYTSDMSSASRTALFNLEKLEWDPELFELFKIPFSVLPKLIENNQIVGKARIGSHYLTIKGVIGDQQAALHAASKLGVSPFSLVYGTGTFVLFLFPDNLSLKEIMQRYWATRHLTITLAWKLEDEDPRYALELSFSNSHQAMDWLLSSSNISIEEFNASDLQDFIISEDKPFCYSFFTKKWFLSDAKSYSASFLNISSKTEPNHVFLSSLEGLAYSIRKGLELMKLSIISRVAVGGGLSNNSLFLKSQSIFLNTELVRIADYQLCSVGAALLVFKGIEFKPPLEMIQPKTESIPMVDGRYRRWSESLVKIYS